MKKSVLSLLLFFLIIFLLPQGVKADEYKFRFEKEDTERANEAYTEYLGKLPADIRDKLSEKSESYDFSYFASILKSAATEALSPAVNIFSTLVGVVILSSVFLMFSKSVKNGGVYGAYSFISTLCMSLAVWEIQKTVFETVENFLKTLTTTVSVITPAMEVISISSGNITSAAVQSAGLELMITLGENVFSKILYPGAAVCFVLAIISALTENGGIAFMSKLIRGLITGALILVMTLMTFVLLLQNSASGAADTFAAKTLRFAVGSYIPIVGGTLSETLSVLASGLGVIKQTCGITGIVVIVIALSSPFFVLLLDRLALSAASSLAAMLGCEKEKNILTDTGGVITLMIAICAVCSFMFIIAISVFLKTPSALTQ